MTIFIFALHGVATGGPEATHQLSDALIEQGFDARLIYFKWADLAQGPLRELPEYAGFAPEYARYKTNLARQAIDEEGHIIVLPETLAHAAPFFRRAKVLIWWLSVDNAFAALAHVNLNQLRRANVYHASQSRYAERFCEALGFNHIGMLSDYTVDLTEYATPMPMQERPKLVAFNARPDKVDINLLADIAHQIERLDPTIRIAAIQGLPRAEIANLFAQARVYVDLGNFPGKDRLPREAASMGVDVLAFSVGGYEGPHQSRINPSETAGEAARLIAARCNSQAPFDPVTMPERTTFFTEARAVFSTLTHEP